MTSVATGKYFLVSSSDPGTCSVFCSVVTQWQPQEQAEERLKEKKKKETNFLYSGDMTHHRGPQRNTV